MGWFSFSLENIWDNYMNNLFSASLCRLLFWSYWLLDVTSGWCSSRLCALTDVLAVPISCVACSFKCFLQTWMYLCCAFIFELILKSGNFSCFSCVPVCNKVSVRVIELETVVDLLGGGTWGLPERRDGCITGLEELSRPMDAVESWLHSAAIESFHATNVRGSCGAEKPWFWCFVYLVTLQKLLGACIDLEICALEPQSFPSCQFRVPAATKSRK